MFKFRRKQLISVAILALLMVSIIPWTSYASDYGTQDLKMGSQGSAVKQLQQDLTELGFYSYSIDGQFGQKTRDAVVAFQKSRGLKADGIVGQQTKAALNAALAAQPGDYGAKDLNLGSQGSAVSQLQTDLSQLGFYSYSIDGQFGQKTHDALVAFQKSRGLKADGIVGQQTKAALKAALAAQPGDFGTKDLKLGSQGSAVSQLQTVLSQLGFYSYSIDGQFGQKTHDAVVEFQKSQGLKTDGLVGAKTKAVLNEAITGIEPSSIASGAQVPTAASVSQYNGHEKPIVDSFRANYNGSLAEALVGRAIWYMEYGFMKYGHSKYASSGYIDCSNFVSLVYKDFGYSITSAAKNYDKVGVKVEGVYAEKIPGSSKYTLRGIEKLKPGDIFTFWNSDAPARTHIGHVAIYMGEINGNPCIINTCNDRPTAIGIINSFAYWYGSSLIEVRRVLPSSAFVPGAKITLSKPVLPDVYQIKPDKPIILPQYLRTGF